MKTQLTTHISERPNLLRRDLRPMLVGLFCLVASLLSASGFCQTTPGHSDATRITSVSKPTDSKDQAPSVKGKAGFRMVIPEIKMRSIIGGPPGKESPPAKEPVPTVEAPPRTLVPDEGPTREPVETTLPQKPTVPRLPFEPDDDAPKESPEVPESRQPEEAPARQIEIPLLKPPTAPEDAIEARPPSKEVLKGKVRTAVPKLLEGKQIKGTLKGLPLESLELEDTIEPREWVPLQKRREPEPMPGSQPPEEPSPQPEQVPDEEAPSSPVPESLPDGEARPMMPSGPALEMVPEAEAPKERPEPGTFPKESGPDEPPARSLPETSPESLPTAPKEFIPSPLDSEAQDSPEVREYLQATAPILEELSLLMTRVPSLTIADFDPSDAEAPVVPKELFIQMDSMKRNLQILDSKTFAVIPPNQYSQFHTIIRDSISHTHQACDAIINFFTQGDITALQQMQEHLLKARQLIRKTRDKTGRG